MEELIANQEQLYVAMEQLLSSFKKTGRERKTADYVTRKLDTLDLHWREFEANHSRLCEYGDENITYFRQGHFQQALEFYKNAKAHIQQCLPKPSTPSGVTGDVKYLTTPSPSMPGPSSKVISTDRIAQGTDSKTGEMLKKQASNFRAFSRTVEDMDLEAVTEGWEYEDLLQQLQSRWSAIDSLHWEIDSELNGSDEEYYRSFSTNEKTYKVMKKAVSSKLWSASHRDKSTPQMEIPTFNGNYYQWVSFKDLFTEAIHSNPSLNNAQKMQFLKSKVRGEAEKIIQHLSISSENYQICWELLNHRYHNKRLLFTSHVNILLNLPTMQHPSSIQIKRIHDTINECLNSIKNLGVDVSTWGPLLVQIMSLKLDSVTYNDYLESLKQPREVPTLKDFLDFLEIKFTTMESSTARKRQEYTVQPRNSSPVGAQKSSKPQNFKSFASNKITSKSLHLNKDKNNFIKSYTCPICSEGHGIFYCQQFLNMTPDVKRRTVSKYNLCKNCLYDHQGKNCFSNKTCRVCNGQHNTILHEAFTQDSIPNTLKNNKSGHISPQGNTCVTQKTDTSEILITTAMIMVQGRDSTYHKMRALVDQCSQMTLITENAAQLLNLPRKRCKGIVSGIGEKESSCKGVITLTCSSIYNRNFTFNVDAYIMNKIIKNLPSCTVKKQSWPHLEGLELADSEFNISRPVDIILGSDIYPELILDGLRKGSSPSMPVAQQTELGWVICGSTETPKLQRRQCNVIINNMEDIQRFWELEDIIEDTGLSTEDQKCVEYYKNTTVRRKDGRYEVRLPLKQDYQNKLGSSKSLAIAQFHQLERRFTKNKHIEKHYKLFINEYISLGHMKRASGNVKPDCFLPHHCVLRADSATTGLRVVFNASAKTSSGTSLNDIMARGPKIQKDLQALILRWRQYQFAFTADIEKMFRQIWIANEDQKLQKIIWRDSPNEPLTEYQLTTVTYGTKAAPFLAMMTLQQLAQDEQKRNLGSDAIKALRESFYTDDRLHGAHHIPLAKLLQRELTEILMSGGFNLRKWRSNSTELLQDISMDESEQDGYDFRQAESTKTLGLRWNCKKDVFLFESKIKPNTSNPTKRSMLSDISKLFDPLGWLLPLTTNLKYLFQSVWVANLQWDDNLPENIKQNWIKSIEDIDNIKHYHIPRWLGIRENQNIELHGFCDASTRAYACVIYCKICDGDNYKVTLVAGKARLVPVSKTISLPKLELMGAHLLSKLMHKVINCLNDYSIKIYGWIDSMVVLGWLNGDPDKWKPFVENRVNQIRKVIPAESWSYVKSKENPADCASRGLSATQLRDHLQWWQGPGWLTTLTSDTKRNLPLYVTEEEVRKPKQVNVIQKSDDAIITQLLNKYSSFTRVVRVLAWILHFISRKNAKQLNYLTLQEITNAKIKIIKYVQQLEFLEEIQNLQKYKQVHNKSKIINLKPFLDSTGILRVYGRLKNANISENMKHPIILPHSGRLTELIINHAHKLTFHGGARLTSSFIRQNYWIIGGNRATKKQIRQCVKCRRNNPSKQHQVMGDLPHPRSNISQPFHHTGVDFTGHIDIKANKGRGIKTTKGYVAVFVCMATKAVHLELVSDLSTSAFLAALRRMAARRGAPRHIYSDNGTNFVGASRILENEYQHLQQVLSDTNVMTEITNMSIQWHFNAPSWPSAGGLWEAAVKSLKYHLKRVICEQKLTYEEYSTLLAQLEACLNSRPLCPLTEDVEDLDYLTPAHFLYGRADLTIVETERDARTRWQLTQKLFYDIWKRWKTEYLTQLTTRSKWVNPQNNIQVGDLVTIQDDNHPPGKWPMGRVVEVHPGRDNYVRVVSLKTKNGIIKRPVSKLSVLPINSNIKLEEQTSQQQPSHTASHQYKYKQKTPTFLSLAMMWILFMNLLSTSFAYFNITQLSDNQTLYFDSMGNMQLIRDDWKLILYYDMAPYWEGTQTINKYLQHMDNICIQIKTRSHCEALLLQLRHSYSEIESYNHMLLGQRNSSSRARRSAVRTERPRRTRRGLINGVGSLAHTLFGVLDENFAEQYQRDITLVRANQNHLTQLFKNQTSVVEAELNMIKRVETVMSRQHKIITQRLHSLITPEIQKISEVDEFISSAIITNNLLTNLKSIQDTLVDTITNIRFGRFNFHLISPEQLRDELRIVAGQLPKDLALPIDNIQTNFHKIYSLLKVRTRLIREYFIFEIKIPLVSRDSYEIYHTISVPQVTENYMFNINPIAKYIAINLRKDTFLQLTENIIQNCFHYDNSVYLCHLQKPVYHRRSDEDLCVKDSDKNKCTISKDVCKNKWIELNKINNYFYFCCNTCVVRILCDEQITAQQISRAGIIKLGSGCVLRSEHFTIYTHKELTNDMRIKADINPPEMAAINHMVNISMPSERNVDSSELHRDLDRLKKRVEDLKQQNYDSISGTVSYHDVHHYTIIYLLVGVGGIIAAAYGWRRCARGRAAVVAAAAATTGREGSDAIESVSDLNVYRVASVSASVARNNKQEKGTSPFTKKPVFTACEQSV